MATQVEADKVKPFLHLDEKGHADILFVLPFSEHEDIAANYENGKLVRMLKKVCKSFAVVSLKPRVGVVKDSQDPVEFAEAHKERLVKLYARYSANVICFLGSNLTRLYVPNIKNDKNIAGTFHTMMLDRKNKAIVFSWLSPKKILNDVYEKVRIPETIAKLNITARKKFYEMPEIVNLDTRKSAKEYLEFLINEHTGFIGFDTETYSLNMANNQRLGSMQFCHDHKTGYVLLWDSPHLRLSNKDKLALRPLLERLFGGQTSFDSWTMQNAMFDVAQIKSEFQVDFDKPILDTMFAAHLLDENRKTSARANVHGVEGGPYGLKRLCTEFNGFFHYSGEAIAARGNGSLMDLPLNVFLDYAGVDPVVTYRLLATFIQWARLDNYESQFLTILRHLHSLAITTYTDMTRTGILLDRDGLFSMLERSSEINKRLVEIKEAYKKIPEVIKVNEELAKKKANTTRFFSVPWVFDINKVDCKQALFFHSKSGYKLPPSDDEEKKYSTGKAFQKTHKENPVVKLYTEAQGLLKLKSSYIQPMYNRLFAKNMDKYDESDLRVHPRFWLTRTVTGRLAASDPNCIAEGTLVKVFCNEAPYTKHTPIENLSIGDKVIALNKKQRTIVSVITNKWYMGEKECLRIHHKEANGATGFTEVTLDHKIKQLDGTYKKAEYLKVGDYVVGHNKITTIDAYATQSKRLICAIENIGIKRVWDIEVAKYHNFFANEICVSNCQQVPRSDSPVKKAIKNLFIPTPGYIYLQADLSSAEVRVWGAISGDDIICKLSQEAYALNAKSRKRPKDEKLREEADLKANFHKQTYGLCFNKDPKDVTPAERQDAKKLSFGLMYGMGDNSLAREVGKPMDAVMKIKKKFFTVYKKGAGWFLESQDFAIRNGYIETPFGRRRRFPQVFTGDKGFIAQAKRFAVNAPIQATSSDYAMLSTCLLYRLIKKSNMQKRVRIVNAVHDSVVLEVKADIETLKWAAENVRETFTNTVTKYIKKNFGFNMKAPIDLDFEVSQLKQKKCEACGNKYPYYMKQCPKEETKKIHNEEKKVKCGCKEYSVVKLKGGWGSLIKLEEHDEGYKLAAMGF